MGTGLCGCWINTLPIECLIFPIPSTGIFFSILGSFARKVQSEKNPLYLNSPPASACTNSSTEKNRMKNTEIISSDFFSMMA